VPLSFANDRLIVPSGVVSRRVNEATVLLNSLTGRYFALDDVGTRAWAVLTASGSIQIAYEALLAEFDADPEHLKNDLERLIETLQDQGLLELRRV
jgi:hypothetical protein